MSAKDDLDSDDMSLASDNDDEPDNVVKAQF